MAATVDVLAIDQGGENKLDAIAQLLRVGETDLAQVVDLGLHGGVLVQRVLGGQSESGGIVDRRPGQGDAHLQLVVDALIDGAADLGAVVDVGVQGEVVGRVADGEVVAGQLRFGRVEGGLQTEQPAEVSDHERVVDDRAGQVQVDVRVKQEVVVLVGCLQDARFLASK